MPRYGYWTLIAMLLAALTGCVGADRADSVSFMKRFHDHSISPDHAVLQVAMIRRPLGDGYINGRLWESTNELFIDLDRLAALNENGFRIGQLVGTPSLDFQQLLLDQRYCQTRALIVSSKTVPLYLLESTIAKTSYELPKGKQIHTVELADARYGFDIAAEFLSDGRTKVKLIPKVEHGETVLPFRAAPELGEWTKTIDKAAQAHPELSWEVTLDQNQCLLIGGRVERLNTLGFNTFAQPAGAGVQQLLVIRNCRSCATQESHQNRVEELVRADKTPPLALQASMPNARAKGQ